MNKCNKKKLSNNHKIKRIKIMTTNCFKSIDLEDNFKHQNIKDLQIWKKDVTSLISNR